MSLSGCVLTAWQSKGEQSFSLTPSIASSGPGQHHRDQGSTPAHQAHNPLLRPEPEVKPILSPKACPRAKSRQKSGNPWCGEITGTTSFHRSLTFPLVSLAQMDEAKVGGGRGRTQSQRHCGDLWKACGSAVSGDLKLSGFMSFKYRP